MRGDEHPLVVSVWRSIDWQRPWVAPYRSHGERVCARLAAGASVAQALDDEAAAARPALAAGGLRFVPHAELPDGEAYESFIARSARVPTRDNLHDFFNGLAWLQAPATLVEALQRRDWTALFVTHRADWSHARLVVFGHALLDKLVTPRKAITAHVQVSPPDIDAASASITQPFLPLPVLGVPGWWSANESPAFYADRDVFRPARHS